MTNFDDGDVAVVVEKLKGIFDALLAFEALPVECKRTRDGWAAYKGTRRITKFYFTETRARQEAE